MKAAAADVRGAVEELVTAGLPAPEEPFRIRLTDAGRELYAKGSAETATVATSQLGEHRTVVELTVGGPVVGAADGTVPRIRSGLRHAGRAVGVRS